MQEALCTVILHDVVEEIREAVVVPGVVFDHREAQDRLVGAAGVVPEVMVGFGVAVGLLRLVFEKLKVRKLWRWRCDCENYSVLLLGPSLVARDVLVAISQQSPPS